MIFEYYKIIIIKSSINIKSSFTKNQVEEKIKKIESEISRIKKIKKPKVYF